MANGDLPVLRAWRFDAGTGNMSKQNTDPYAGHVGAAHLSSLRKDGRPPESKKDFWGAWYGWIKLESTR